MTQQRINAEDLASGNWEHILVAAGLDPAFLTYNEGPCPICGGNTRFRWRKPKQDAFCNHCRHLSGFALLQHLQKCDFRGACDFIRRHYGYEEGSNTAQPVQRIIPKPVQAERDDTEDLRVKYKTLWDEGFTIGAGMPAFHYLHKRVPGLKAVPKVLRAHPRLAYWQRGSDDQFTCLGEYPAMLAVAQGLDGMAVNVWRTYLDAEGNKADLPDAKKGTGRFLQQSFAVRLTEPDDELGVAEGIETALAVTALYGIPCWAALNAGGVAKFDLPAGYERVKKVRVYADNDVRDKFGRRAGNDAAQKLKDRMRAAGKVCTIILPRFTNFDFADVAKNRVAESTV